MREEQLEWRREKVEKFAARMQEMVAWKAGKGTWLNYKLSQAMGELMEEIGEVGKLLHKGILTEARGSTPTCLNMWMWQYRP